MTTEHEAARAVLAELRSDYAGECGGAVVTTLDTSANVAALLRYARRAKAEALRDYHNRLPDLPGHFESRDLREWLANEIAKLEETP
jgi:hypothetical protein